MSARFAWVKSVSGTVQVGPCDVSTVPVKLLVTPAMSTAFRDGYIVVCDEPVEVPETDKTGGKKK